MNVRAKAVVCVALSAVLLGGCDNMKHQENARAGDGSTFFADGAASRVPPAHTLAVGTSGPADPLSNGRIGGNWQVAFPVTVDRALLERGRERYAVFCADCHGDDGYGRGIVVLRGFPAPRSFHETGLRSEPPGRLFEAITHGSGAMYGFGDRIGPRDRWAIVAFVRALQRSQYATPADVPTRERERLEAQ
jgi:mono/diheme cytochrome c family protein